MLNLYAYFGLLDLHDVDTPGHSLYQLGLLDSIEVTYGPAKFDFYSYYPDSVIEGATIGPFPETQLGELFHKTRNELINRDDLTLDQILVNIKEREYDTLYLKARFRNLSTLAKKWKDAREFEKIIHTAMESGYTKKNIVILDTDLSLSQYFIDKYSDFVTILIPSIDFPGISERFLMDCINAGNYKTSVPMVSVFYGNIDTSKYKAGNSKSPILGEVLNQVSFYHNVGPNSTKPFYVICKESDFNQIEKKPNTQHIARNNRFHIWEALSTGSIMLNVTKEKYNDVGFIPARVFEALIFGMIPVSFKFEFLSKAFSFESIDELDEIYQYLYECDDAGFEQAYLYYVASYLDYSRNLPTKYLTK